MGKNEKKSAKTPRAKKAPVKGLPVTDLPVKDATRVKGGLVSRKAGGRQLDY